MLISSVQLHRYKCGTSTELALTRLRFSSHVIKGERSNEHEIIRKVIVLGNKMQVIRQGIKDTRRMMNI